MNRFIVRGVAAFAGAVTVLAAAGYGSPVHAASAADCELPELANASFEKPVIKGNWKYETGDLPGWTITSSDPDDDDKPFMLHRSGTSSLTGEEDVEAADGKQYLGLIGLPLTYHQDLKVKPGTTFTWSLATRAVWDRDSDNWMFGDVPLDEDLTVEIGAPDATKPQKPTGTDSTAMAPANGKWTTYSGEYTVPDGQTTIRFLLRLANENPTALSGANVYVDGVALDCEGKDKPPYTLTDKSVSNQSVTPSGGADAGFGGGQSGSGGSAWPWIIMALVAALAAVAARVLVVRRRRAQS